MDNHFINALLFLCLCFIPSLSIHTYAINCTSNEREALIAFRESLLDPSARLSSWTGENCCDWYGVTCNFISGKVTKIDLRNSLGYTKFLSTYSYERQNFEVTSQELKKSCLGGEISPSLLELEDLNYLDLSLNNFNGTPIPYFFGMLRNLRYLYLSSAYFGGEIPLHLGNLSNLRYLDLSIHDQYILRVGLNFKVKNLPWLSGLSSLEYLDVGGVDLSSLQANWMPAINSLSSLSELYLNDCNIPSFDSSAGFLNLTSLRVLDLSNNYLKNSLLPLWLSNLTSLTKLELSYNNFHGTIPRDFVKLKNLQYLDLSANNLRKIGDHMPSCLRNLGKLQFLNLAYNNFGCTIDELLGSSSANCSHNSLEVLSLGQNELVGEISNSLGTLYSLQYLDLSDNKLWGSLPNSIGNLSLLQLMDISSNFFNGTIPLSFGQLSKLIKFYAGGNSWKTVITENHLMNLTKLELLQIATDKNQALVFNVSYDWIPPFRLKTLYLRNCLVGPQFPVWLRVQTQLTRYVSISNAGIRDFIPNDWISNLSLNQIVSLDLSNNLLKGKLSHLFASQHGNPIDGGNDFLEDSFPLRFPNLILLELRHNLLSGPIPSNIGDVMPNLRTLFLSRNQLIGSIPPSIQEMSSLEIISLSDNQLLGELFYYWGKLKSLSVIDLANNNLYGKIPSSIGLLKSLDKLILNNNNLHGEIPKSLQNCSRLTSIDLSKNKLYGSLPSWIGGDVSNFLLINLRFNHFSGTIPRQWCNLPLLRILDLSNNNISGEIPSCLYNWKALAFDESRDRDDHLYTFNGTDSYSSAEKTTLVMKGRELEYDVILLYVLTIDISSNKLNGAIPNEITNLHRLGTLNLSNNHLVGTIPINIGAMQQLQTLDLSCNHLSGNIPTSLASLNFLTHLNLSFNNLTGIIPTGKQLQTLNDPSIYEGNPLLTKSSSSENTNNIIPISTSEEEDGKENDSEMFGFYISMAIGFPIGLNILFFTIFTNESRTILYFRFIDGVSYNILEGIGFAIICMRRMRWRRV